MNAEEREILNKDYRFVEQSRPIWHFEDKFTEEGKNYPVTFLICQKNDKAIIQLSIESILRFYPDVNICIMDDQSDNTECVQYLRFKELTTPNLKVITRPNHIMGHGCMLDEALLNHIKTEYCILMDSDVQIVRGGFVEKMLEAYSDKKLYAIGTLQVSSYKNNGDEPIDINDVVLYANPQLSMIHVPTYHELVEVGTDSWGNHVPAPFLTDGTPLILNMKAARDCGLTVKDFPTDYYSLHTSGSGWTTPSTITINDQDIKLRPFLTIIISGQPSLKMYQNDTDFDLVITGKRVDKEVIFTDGSEKKSVNNYLYSIRFNVQGEYVLDCSDDEQTELNENFLTELKQKVIDSNIPDRVEVRGRMCVRRRVWQQEDCLMKK